MPPIESSIGKMSKDGWKPYEQCRHDESIVMRYGFDTPDEMIKRLKAVCWGIDDKTIASVVAGAFRAAETNRQDEDQATIELPTYIYAF